jgi:hypothetical protein
MLTEYLRGLSPRKGRGKLRGACGDSWKASFCFACAWGPGTIRRTNEWPPLPSPLLPRRRGRKTAGQAVGSWKASLCLAHALGSRNPESRVRDCPTESGDFTDSVAALQDGKRTRCGPGSFDRLRFVKSLILLCTCSGTRNQIAGGDWRRDAARTRSRDGRATRFRNWVCLYPNLRIGWGGLSFSYGITDDTGAG